MYKLWVPERKEWQWEIIKEKKNTYHLNGNDRNTSKKKNKWIKRRRNDGHIQLNFLTFYLIFFTVGSLVIKRKWGWCAIRRNVMYILTMQEKQQKKKKIGEGGKSFGHIRKEFGTSHGHTHSHSTWPLSSSLFLLTMKTRWLKTFHRTYSRPIQEQAFRASNRPPHSRAHFNGPAFSFSVRFPLKVI